MRMRVARHTHDLSPMIGFYTEVIGLRVLGEFEAHEGYDGIFLGFPGQDWEIEFTVSGEKPGHVPDEDDLLVFYFESGAQIEAILKRGVQNGSIPVRTKNPYWNRHGHTLRDPDGFLVTLALKTVRLQPGNNYSDLALSHGIIDWNQLLEHVKHLPYGRNANRSDYGLVLTEGKGSCSTKHALLKAIADENGIEAALVMGMYKMNRSNTRAIGDTLENAGLSYIPEAHCYLLLSGSRFDFTSAHSDIERIGPDIIEEIAIEPAQTDSFKVTYHQDFIRRWIGSEKIGLGFDAVWGLREACIRALSDH